MCLPVISVKIELNKHDKTSDRRDCSHINHLIFYLQDELLNYSLIEELFKNIIDK